MVWIVLKEYLLILEEILLLSALFHVGLKKEKRARISFLCILALIALMSVVALPNQAIRLIIFDILDFAAFCIIVRLSFLRKITFYCFSYAICGLVEIFLMWLIKNESLEWRSEIGSTDFFLLRLSLCLLLFMIGKIRWKEKKEPPFPLTVYWYITLIACLFGTLLAVFLFSEVQHIVNNKKIISQFAIILLGIILFGNTAGIVLLVERRKIDKERMDLQAELLRLQEKYYAELTEKQSVLRSMKHDIKAHLTAIDRLNRNNEHEEVRAYLDKLLLVSNIIAYSDYDTGNKIANIVINYFADLSKENKIIFEYEGYFEEGLKMTELEINSLLYNILFNAFEECMRLSDYETKKINLDIKNLHKTLLIIASNSCRGDTSEEAETGFATSKNDKESHGLGIKIIKSIVANYHGEVKFKCEKKMWAVEMMFLDAYIIENTGGVQFDT